MPLGTTSTYFMDTSRDSDSTTFLGSPFQWLKTLSENKFFQISNLNLPWYNLRPLPHVPALMAVCCSTTGRCLVTPDCLTQQGALPLQHAWGILALTAESKAADLLCRKGLVLLPTTTQFLQGSEKLSAQKKRRISRSCCSWETRQKAG